MCLRKMSRKTGSSDLKEDLLKNGTKAMKGKCAKCGTIKYVFIANAKFKSGGSIVNAMLNKLPMPELHMKLPKSVESEQVPAGSFNKTGKYSFCGPFTKPDKRLREGYRGVNKLDRACLGHDIAYSESSDVKERNKADDILAHKAVQILTDSFTPDYEKQDSRLVTGIMGTKARFGL